MKKNTIITLLLLAVLAMTALLAGCGKTDEPTYSEGLEFKLDDAGTGYVVSGIGSCEDTKIIIPPTYEELPVTGIARKAFYGCDSLTSVTIPASVERIASEAFSVCTSLTSITILEGVTTIGYSAFSGCISLTSVSIPGSVTYIGQYAFASCTSLSGLTIPASVTRLGEGAFYMCTSLTSIQYGGTVAEWKTAAPRMQAAGFNCTITCTDGTIQY